MAGTLTISTLSDGTNSTSSTNCIQGSAKAWVNFNGASGPTIRSSYNVSSITQLAGVSWDVNFTNAMPNINYAVGGCASDDGVSLPAFGESGSNLANRTTGKVRVILNNGVTRTCISVMVMD